VVSLEHVIAISCGEQHSLALTREGKVYAWGLNSEGQLGIASHTNGTKVPKLCKIEEEVIAIACGGRHSLALTKDRKLLGWGSNYFGQLGMGYRRASKVPRLVEGLSGVYQITCGEHHSLALSIDGKLYSFGNNENGQLGNGSDAHLHEPHGQVARLLPPPPEHHHHHHHHLGLSSSGTSLAHSGKKLSGRLLS
jgi:alpha-tubulin suppressor-like RCC1 family protein